jgi:hypothetical protein
MVRPARLPSWRGGRELHSRPTRRIVLTPRCTLEMTPRLVLRFPPRITPRINARRVCGRSRCRSRLHLHATMCRCRLQTSVTTPTQRCSGVSTWTGGTESDGSLYRNRAKTDLPEAFGFFSPTPIALTASHRNTSSLPSAISAKRDPQGGRAAARPDTPVRCLRSTACSGLIDGTDTPPQGGPRHDSRSSSLDHELQAFARWFADWWLRRGRGLTDHAQHGR